MAYWPAHIEQREIDASARRTLRWLGYKEPANGAGLWAPPPKARMSLLFRLRRLLGQLRFWGT